MQIKYTVVSIKGANKVNSIFKKITQKPLGRLSDLPMATLLKIKIHTQGHILF